MATLKRPPRGRIIKPSVKDRRKGQLILPTIRISGTQLGTSTKSNTTTSPMSQEDLKSQKVRGKQSDYIPYNSADHGPLASFGTPQLAESLQPESVPFRFSFRKSEELLESADNTVWQSGVAFSDRESMFSRERSYVLSTPFNGTRPQNDLDKEKLSELQIIVGRDNGGHEKPVKRRLLRKPLPFSHYKKSQKVRIIHPIEYGYESSQESLRLNLLGHQTSDTTKHDDQLGGEEDIKKQSKKLVKTWLKQIDRKIEGSDVDQQDCSNDESDLDIGVDKTAVDKSLNEKQLKRIHRSRKSARLLPDLNSMSPQSKMSARYLDNNEPVDNEGVDKDKLEDNAMLTLPAIPTKDTVSATKDSHLPKSSGKENTQPEDVDKQNGMDLYPQQFDSEHLPSILLPSTLNDTEELERERLRLIHLDKHGLDMNNHFPYSIQSEPCYASFAMNTFNSKGASSRSTAHKKASLRDMAAAFKSKMGYAVASPTHCGDRMWKDRISNYSSTVIHHETYDNFARQKFPKTKLPGNPSSESNGSDIKPRLASFTNAHGTFRKPLYEGNTSARSLSEDSGRIKRNKSGDQLTKIKLKTREFSNASLNSLGSSMKSDRNSGVFKGRKFSTGPQDPDTTKSKKFHRSDSNLSLASVRGSSKKGSSKLKRRGSKHRTIGIGVNE